MLLSVGDVYGPTSRTYLLKEISLPFAVCIEGREMLGRRADAQETKSNSPRGQPYVERVGIIGVSALPPAPPYPISQGAIVRSPPQALR